MKILYVVTRSDEIGGAQIHVRDLAEEAVRRGHEVAVLAGGSGALFDQLARKGVPSERIPALGRPIRPARDLQALVQLLRVLRREKPDLVSLHSSKAGLLGRLAAKAAGAPAVFTAHGWAFTEGVPRFPRFVFRILEGWAAPLAARIITVSEYDRHLALRARVGRPDKVVTVHNGMPDVGGELRAAPGDGGPVRIAMVARFSGQKDHETLLRALARIHTPKEWILELLGTGPREEEVAGLAEGLGLGARVEFSGEVEDVASRLARSQLYVLSSNWEGLPRSIIEAMRAGLPVVASDVGGVRELVGECDNGFLVEPGDSRALAERLGALIGDPDMRRRMGHRGRERYEQDFRFDEMVANTLAVYEGVIGPSEEGARG